MNSKKRVLDEEMMVFELKSVPSYVRVSRKLVSFHGKKERRKEK